MKILSQLAEQYSEAQANFKPITDVAYAPLASISALFGRPMDQVMILFCLLIAFFLNILLSLIKEPFYRKLVSTFGGIAISTYAYGLGIIFLIPYNMIGYVCMCLVPRK
jgi:ABC-type Na+ efflux pump permease subunit